MTSKVRRRGAGIPSARVGVNAQSRHARAFMPDARAYTRAAMRPLAPAVVVGLFLALCACRGSPGAAEGEKRELWLRWDTKRSDNFVTATTDGNRDADASGYTKVRKECSVFTTQVQGAVPLKLYWNELRGDNFTTATPEGEKSATDAGYKFVRVEGYVYPSERPGTAALKLFWSAEHQDNFTTATAEGEKSAQQAGYVFVRVEGYAPAP